MSLSAELEKSVDSSFFTSELKVGGKKFSFDFDEMLSLTKGEDDEFYSPYDVGEKLNSIGFWKTVVYNVVMEAIKERRAAKKKYERKLAEMHKLAESAIVEERKDRKQTGQITAQNLADWVALHADDEFFQIEAKYEEAKSNEMLLKEYYEILKSRALELQKIANIALSEWEAINQNGIKIQGIN